ncbi:PHD finger protein male meiocyte death 1 [Tanacetum coccineum]
MFYMIISNIGDTGLVDYVLKSMNNVIVRDYVVRRAVNGSTCFLEYSLTEFDQYEETSDQFDSETSEKWPFKDAADEYLRFISRMVPLVGTQLRKSLVEIVKLEGVDEDDVIFGTIESGSEIMVRGYEADLLTASDLNYDGEVDNWVVNCQYGAGDDDGERMVACDLCIASINNRFQTVPISTTKG